MLRPWKLATDIDQSDGITASLVVPVGRYLERFHQQTKIGLVHENDRDEKPTREFASRIRVADLDGAAAALYKYLGAESTAYWGALTDVSYTVACMFYFLFFIFLKVFFYLDCFRTRRPARAEWGGRNSCCSPARLSGTLRRMDARFLSQRSGSR